MVPKFLHRMEMKISTYLTQQTIHLEHIKKRITDTSKCLANHTILLIIECVKLINVILMQKSANH